MKSAISEALKTADYDQLIREIGDVKRQTDEKGYSGCSWVLYEDYADEESIGYLCFGWGSCSGCDWLSACSSEQDVQELFEELSRKTLWFPTRGEALEFFKKRDWALVSDSYCIGAEFEDFLNQSVEYLSGDRKDLDSE